MQELLPAIRQADEWDVFIAHYLGLDHIGHAHNIESPLMTAKVHQMDNHIGQVSGFGLLDVVLPGLPCMSQLHAGDPATTSMHPQV